MKKFLLWALALTLVLPARADEGMWLLPLLEKMNGKALREAGCRLTPQEIYNINGSSLKDAIVHFGGGCTAEIISAEGLLVTNHHCGYSSIQGLSTPEHNYLMDGWWARNRDEELKVPGLTVTFLRKMEDVTDAYDRAEDKKAFVKEAVARAEKDNPGCKAFVTSFYNKNYWYLITTRVYRDIRFVGAPPASIGKFGGETDNWMWPRHTGDFSMFRVYDDDGKPLRAARHLKISLKDLKEGDYTMILGYPGRTQRFQTAAELNQMIATNRIRIDARTVRQQIMWDAMCADPDVQLKYADKYASSANGWKKWQGEELAFGKLGIIAREERKEADFVKWYSAKKPRAEKYQEALSDISTAVEGRDEAMKALTLLYEAPLRIELLTLANVLGRRGPEALKDYYKDYVEEIDRKEAVALLTFYRERARKEDYPKDLGDGSDFATMEIGPYVDYLFDTSVLTSPEKLEKALAEEGGLEKIKADDPAFALRDALMAEMMKLYPALESVNEQYEKGSKAFAAGLLEWEKGKPSYPDANSTMRLTYGHVMPYSPKDAVLFQYYTTLEGVMQKEDPTNPEFIVPEKLKKLFEAKDYGRYAAADGRLRTCFLTNNDITGGNSGSPVMDADGNLIGLAFDGNWESMSSDVMFEPDLQRCICVDIHYVLFLVDKFGGAGHLIKEMEFAK
jgi:hypothetical protein